MSTARRLLNADHRRMILMMHSDGKTDEQISTWFRESQKIDLSRIAVNRERRRLLGQAPQSPHTAQSTAAAGAALLDEFSTDDLTVPELVDTLLRARFSAAMAASRANDGTAAACATRDFIGLAQLAEKFPLEDGKPQTEPVEHLRPVFYVVGKDGERTPLNLT